MRRLAALRARGSYEMSTELMDAVTAAVIGTVKVLGTVMNAADDGGGGGGGSGGGVAREAGPSTRQLWCLYCGAALSLKPLMPSHSSTSKLRK